MRKGKSFTHRIYTMIAMAVFSLLMVSCGIYSFSGVSISPSVKTIQVDVFPNNAPLVNPTLSSYFTNELQDVYSSRTSLMMVKNNGDLVVEGEITRYDQTSVAPVIDPTTGKATAAKIPIINTTTKSSIKEKPSFCIFYLLSYHPAKHKSTKH